MIILCFGRFAWGIFILCGVVQSCYIQGTDSGNCSTLTLDPIWRAQNMPYCYKAVTYPACLPLYQPLSASREFPTGRFFNHTVQKKDAWVGQNALQHIAQQIGYERSKTLKKQNRDVHGHTGHVRRRFYRRANCQNAFKNYFCWINFPRCDPQRDLTFPTCRSACENFFKSCRYQLGLWRCGKSKYFNGYAPELPTKMNGTTGYLREYFPGQPFRENKYTLKGDEIPICTPAILGAANSNMRLDIWVLIGIIVLLVTVLETRCHTFE